MFEGDPSSLKLYCFVKRWLILGPKKVEWKHNIGFFSLRRVENKKKSHTTTTKTIQHRDRDAKCWHKLLLLLLLCITYALQEYQDLQHKQHSIYRHRQTVKPTHRDTDGLLNYKGAHRLTGRKAQIKPTLWLSRFFLLSIYHFYNISRKKSWNTLSQAWSSD